MPLPGLGPWRASAPAEFRRFPDDAVARPIGARFAQVAAEFAAREAISSPLGQWSYRRVAEDAERIAGGLQARLGLGTSRPVAVLVDHDGLLPIAVLSVIRAGHIVVVLDPAAPEPQIQQILTSCEAPLLLHDSVHAELAGRIAGAAEAIHVDEVTGEFTEPSDLGERSPAMLAFTSGTSDEPKGAVITHGVLMNLVRGATNALGIGPEDRMPMLFPVSLAVAAYPMFLPLLTGGTLATLDVRSVGLEPVGEFLERERITLAYMAPTVIRFLDGALGDRTFPDLRMVALGGELVDAEVVDLTRRLFSPTLMANGYGTTETGVVALYVLDPSTELSGAAPCGFAVDDVEIVVLDDQGTTLGPDEPGELAVLSPHLFTGYWKHPELSRQVLFADPLGREGWGMFRTGDHGSVDRNGVLTVHGRVDTKVKVRGKFVVIGEIESDLHGLDGVSDAAVMPDVRAGNTELVAFVVPSADFEGGPTGWRADLLERRESFMVPSRWVVLDELPRLPNGKLDRRALPIDDSGALDASAPELERPDLSGREATRRTIKAVWEGLLPVGSIGEDEDFFHLGGDSLLAAQMLIHVERETGVIVPMGELVHARTVRTLADVVDRHRDVRGHPAPLVSCVQRGDAAARPQLWFVPDLQGSAFRVRHLAEALGADQPVWSFESPLVAGEPNPFTRLETFAARLLTDLRRVQPEGPYWLSGYSFGGICAYEMARQLELDGEAVAFVSVVDVGPGYRGPGWSATKSPGRPWFGVAKPPPAGSSAFEAVRHYLEMVSTSRSGALRHLMVRTGVARVVDPIRFRADLRRHGRVRPEWRLWYAWEEHWKLAAKHWDRASAYPGTMDLFWEATTGSVDSTMGWSALIGDLRIHRFAVGADGDHDAILEPAGARALGPVLRSVIDERLESPHSRRTPDGN